MSFDPKASKTASVQISPFRATSDIRPVTCLINPEAIVEKLTSNINSVQTVNANLPRHIINGTKGRELTFTILLHRMENADNKNVDSSFKNQLGSSRFDAKGFAKGLLSAGITQGISLIPFAKNISQGISTLANLTGLDILGDEFSIKKKINPDSVEESIAELFKMISTNQGNKPATRVQITPYPAFANKTFYITEISVNRKFFDPKLNTQFAEVSVTMTQVGVDRRTGDL